MYTRNINYVTIGRYCAYHLLQYPKSNEITHRTFTELSDYKLTDLRTLIHDIIDRINSK